MRRIFLSLLPIAVMVLIAAVFFARNQPPPPITRAVDLGAGQTGTPAPPQSPTLVGRKVCGECHADNFQHHSHHGHASTFHFVSETDLASIYAGKEFDAGDDFGTYRYQADEQGNLFVTLESEFGDQPFPLPFALGSRHHAQTLLTLVPSPTGQTDGIEHRVSCYADNRIDLTPGHSKKRPQNSLEFFGAASTGKPLQRCIYCHTTRGTVVGESIENLIANVNCEKCHGPGSEHVRLARLDGKPPPYSVGQSTWDAESELQLCGDCHRLPRSVAEQEIREYPDLLTRFQPIGLVRSRCYLATKRELRCTTCHNPHQTISELTESDHVQNCVNCHQSETPDHVACPVQPKTGCIDCHMPAIPTDQGLSFHDHWIRVHDQTRRR